MVVRYTNPQVMISEPLRLRQELPVLLARQAPTFPLCFSAALGCVADKFERPRRAPLKNKREIFAAFARYRQATLAGFVEAPSLRGRGQG